MRVFLFALFVAAAVANPSPSDKQNGKDSVPIGIVEPALIPEPVVIAPEIVPEPVIVVPEPISPEIVPEPVIVVPEPISPEIVPEPVIVVPEPISPEIVPEPVIVVPEAVPEIVAEPVQVVEAAQVVNGEIFNDGVVQVTVNTPEETGVLSTLQSWFSMALNYISGGVQTTQQIV